MPKQPRALWVAAGFGGLLLLSVNACGGLSTLGPTPQGEGIIVFIHADYARTSQALNVDVSLVWVFCASSAERRAPAGVSSLAL